jgi:hypothetical protein
VPRLIKAPDRKKGYVDIELPECAARVHAASFCCSSDGTLGSYLRDALQDGSAGAVARLPFPRAQVFFLFPSFYFVAYAAFSVLLTRRTDPSSAAMLLCLLRNSILLN